MSRLLSASRLLAAAATLLALAAPAATAGPLQGTATVTTPSTPIVDQPEHRLAGDFNGDGYDDYVTTLDAAFGESMWTASVIFGSPSIQNLELTRVGTTGKGQVRFVNQRGVQIRPVADPAVRNYHLGAPTVVGVGDMDRDGFDDLAVSTPTFDPSQPHRVYIVHGAASKAQISLADPSRVTTVQVSPTASDVRSDAIVSPVGDFDGDGYDDLAVTRSTGKASDYSAQPGASIVKGGPRVAAIDATKTGPRSALVTGQRTCQFVIWLLKNVCVTEKLTLTGIGDFDGDGKDDVVVDSGKDDSSTILLGRTGTFTVAAGTVKLSGATFSRYWISSSVRALGDVNGDGLGDVGFRGPQSAAGGGAMNVLLGRRAPGTSVSLTGLTTITSATRSITGITGAGDQDGDGRDEVAVVTDPIADEELYCREVKVTSIGAAGATIQVDGIAPVPGLPSENIEKYEGTTLLGGGADFDRDGHPDLLYSDAYRPTLTVVTSGIDRAAPELFPAFSYGADPADPAYRPGVKLEPFDFSTATGTTRSVRVREAATVDFKVVRADGSVVGTDSRAVPAGFSSDRWDGAVNGVPLPIGRYVLLVSARDASGNRGREIRYPVGIVGQGDEAGEPATIRWKARLLGPDGSVNRYAIMDADVTCPTEYPNHGLGYDDAGYDDGAIRLSGQSCSVVPKPLLAYGRICDQDLTVTHDGAALQAVGGRSTFRLAAGENVVVVSATCREPAATGPVAPLATEGWVYRGDASGVGNPEQVLLGSEPDQTASTVWNALIDPREKTFEFWTFINGGNEKTEGLAMAFLPASSNPATGFIGAGGGRLGVGGLGAIALGVDLTKGPGDTRSSAVGLAQGTTASGMNWLQTADPGVKVNEYGRQTVFKLVSKGGNVSVYVDGKLKFTRALTLPAQAYLAFTGATSAAAYQGMYIGGLKVTDS